MPWPRIRFTLAVIACLTVGTFLGALELAITSSPRLERWLARRY